MRTLYIRHVPDEVAVRLEKLAAQAGLPLSTFDLQELTKTARRADNAELLNALPSLPIERASILEALSGSRVEHRRINPGIAMTATRLEVRIPEQLNDRLEALAAEEGMTNTDLFRRALALYMLTKERQKAGAQLQFAQGNNTETLVSI